MSKISAQEFQKRQLQFDFLFNAGSAASDEQKAEEQSGVTSSRLDELNQRLTNAHYQAVQQIALRDAGQPIKTAGVATYAEGEVAGFYYPERYREKFLAADAMQVHVDEVGGVYDDKGYGDGTLESNILAENNPFPSKESKQSYDAKRVDWGLNLKENKYFELINPKVENANNANGFSYFLSHEEYKLYVECKFAHAEKMYEKSLQSKLANGARASDLPPVPEGVSAVALALSVKTMLASIVQVSLTDYIKATSISEGEAPSTPKKFQNYQAAQKEAAEIVAYFKDQVPGLKIPFSRIYHNLDLAEQISLPDFVDMCVHEPENMLRGISAYMEALGGAKANGRSYDAGAHGSVSDDLCDAAEREVESAYIEAAEYDDDAPAFRG